MDRVPDSRDQRHEDVEGVDQANDAADAGEEEDGRAPRREFQWEEHDWPADEQRVRKAPRKPAAKDGDA